ncbi:hypothetical protein PHPALM_30366 [Phytophthora palmivora]|uniref:Tc1-like transposase DDE domain-containing protein n=1 Tax=Phytophthora palmivora TaxID=4796 RepID=A0A2P4X5C3_9STRA|nr:hypothetical protein PHPALM_30366 [Phytophthora palmivora]
MLVGRGWSAGGRRAVQTGVAIKTKNIHVIAVISSLSLAYQERHISTTMPLKEIMVVLDNAPCHTDAEDVFDESKMAVKRFLAHQRAAILRVPDGTTITEH